MARLPRIELVGVPQHIIQRGNNRQVCFTNDNDLSAYANWLKIYAQKFNVQIHAWVFMTNHVHLLCTPMKFKAISQMMQGVGRQYVRYFNHKYKRTGTLWEGRFKSCLVQQETYLLQLYRYIELNPVRAGMVTDPSMYSWSSHQINAVGKVSELCTPHPHYLALGSTPEQRCEAYRALFQSELGQQLQTKIRQSTNKGLALGSEKFKCEVAQLIGRTVTEGKRGRPLGWRKGV